MWAADGTAYLDCVNNVAHVGHCHPKVCFDRRHALCDLIVLLACARRLITLAHALQVCTAVAQQMFQLNTNSRYLHENFSAFAEALTATMPDPLSVMCAPIRCTAI